MVGERPFPVEGGLPVPLPLVTDLDGDGKNEVVVLADGGMLIRLLSVPAASGETLVRNMVGTSMPPVTPPTPRSSLPPKTSAAYVLQLMSRARATADQKTTRMMMMRRR